MEDRLMTAKQLALYLSVNERTVLKLVAEGSIPGVKVGNQWRFRKKMIDTWLDDQMLGLSPSYIDSAQASHRKMLNLSDCFSPTQIVDNLRAETKIGVIEELATTAADLGLVRDKTWFVGALIERENVMPSAIGGGVAYLHTLHRNPQAVHHPFLILGRSRPGIDFDALDGELTHLFFLLGLKFEELYLPWMQKLLQILVAPDVREQLMAAEGSEPIFTFLVGLENQLSRTARG